VDRVENLLILLLEGHARVSKRVYSFQELCVSMLFLTHTDV